MPSVLEKRSTSFAFSQQWLSIFGKLLQRWLIFLRIVEHGYSSYNSVAYMFQLHLYTCKFYSWMNRNPKPWQSILNVDPSSKDGFSSPKWGRKTISLFNIWLNDAFSCPLIPWAAVQSSLFTDTHDSAKVLAGSQLNALSIDFYLYYLEACLEHTVLFHLLIPLFVLLFGEVTMANNHWESCGNEF